MLRADTMQSGATGLPTEDLAMLAHAAGQFAKSGAERARLFRGTVPGYDGAAWRVIAEQGWLSMLVPEARGGLGAGMVAACTVARRFGRAVLPEPFVADVRPEFPLALRPRRRAGPDHGGQRIVGHERVVEASEHDFSSATALRWKPHLWSIMPPEQRERVDERSIE